MTWQVLLVEGQRLLLVLRVLLLLVVIVMARFLSGMWTLLQALLCRGVRVGIPSRLLEGRGAFL